ncbi:hypothetical protein DFJ74DRAFT_655222 [Hyaloraphidium curvatum]|nr:hypothetical protein DFJ74DRAFT_655222 [Hyaloraphidium curvatum]
MHKFPRTPHLFHTGGTAVSSDDILLDDLAPFLGHELTVEEKADGANLALSLSTGTLRAQNRGRAVDASTHRQFSNLGAWAAERSAALWEVLGGTDRVLYGEWMRARHSMAYDRLPDWFLAVDVWDPKAGGFLSVEARDALIARANAAAEESGQPGICTIRRVARRSFSCREELAELLEATRSAYCEGPAEGLYFRLDDGPLLVRRAKLVRPDFIQGIDEHWTKKEFEKNSLAAFSSFSGDVQAER